MERLTTKVDDIYTCSYCENQEAIDRLAEFEDFMESLGCEKLEELEHLIGYPRFVDGYDEQGNEIHRVDFVTYKESFNEYFNKYKTLKQENQALKDRWEKLREYIDTHCLDKCAIKKMQELEKS